MGMKTYPAADDVIVWLKSLSGMLTRVRTQYGSFPEMVEHPDWDGGRTEFALNLIKSLRDTSSRWKRSLHSMSVRNSARTEKEKWQYAWRKLQDERPGSFRAEELVDFALEHNLVDKPDVDPKKILLRKARQAAREARIRDRQGRLVREMLPAKVPLKVDENGNILMFEVRYDHIHAMSTDHAFLAFDQRDHNIKRQQR